MTILELLVVFALMAVLIALILPAVQAVREAARNLQCTNNIRQIGVALHNFHDSHRMLPPGWQLEASKESSYGWATWILKEIEESNLDGQIDRIHPLASTSEAVRSTTPESFLCPSDTGEPVFPLFVEIGEHGNHAQQSNEVLMTLPRANYVGVFGTTDPDDVPGESGSGFFVMSSCRGFKQATRGLSHVLLVGERTTRKLASTWIGVANKGEDAQGRLVGYADLGPDRSDADECEFDSRHPGHVNFVCADGHVESVYDDIDRQVYKESAMLR